MFEISHDEQEFFYKGKQEASDEQNLSPATNQLGVPGHSPFPQSESPRATDSCSQGLRSSESSKMSVTSATYLSFR